MKRLTTFLMALLLTWIGASAQSSWTAPTLPTSTLESGGEYYLYNTEAGQFMGNASLMWGSEAAFTESGFLATLTYDESNSAYTIYNNGINNYTGYVFRDGNYLYVDGSSSSNATNYARRFFTFTAVGDGTYTIHTAWLKEGDEDDGYSGYLGYDGTNEIKTTLSSTSTGIYWELIAEEAEDLYDALVILYNTLVHAESYGMTNENNEVYKNAGELYLSSTATVDDLMEAVVALEIAMEGYASEDDPDDVTLAYITNPDFDSYSGNNFTGWTNSDMTYQSTPKTNGDITISVYPEKWVASTSSLSDAKISQTLANLPVGTYSLEADAIAVVQSNSSTPVTGVYLYASSQFTSMTSVSTGDGLPEHYSVSFEVAEEGSVEIGFEVSNSDASWVAVDNFVLYYLGEEVTAVTDTESEYKKGDVIEIEGSTYYVQCDNMVQNHSFELGFEGWTDATDNHSTLTSVKFDLRSDDPKDGEVYLFGITNESSSGAGSICTAWAIETGKTYYFSYWIKNLTGATDTQYLKTSLTNSIGDETVSQYPASVSSDWQKVEYIFEKVSYNYVQVKFRWLDSQWAFDNFQLYEIDEDLLPVDWEMTEAGWGTLILPFDADVPDGLTAYSCAGLEEDNETLSLTEETTLASCTPYILKGAADTYSFTGAPENEKDKYQVGLLVGTLTDMSLDDGDFSTAGTEYVLQDHEDEGLAFYPITDESEGVTLDAYHCYLNTGAVVSALRLPGMSTGIVAVEGDVIANDAIYDLSGRRVTKAVKGVYIQNGKKVLVK